MKYNIYINQKAVTEHFASFDLDLIDMAIFDYCRDIIASPSEKMRRLIIGGIEHTWISYSHLIKNMPLLGIKTNDVIRRRMNKLVVAGMLVRHTDFNMSYFRLGNAASVLFFDGGESDITPDKQDNPLPDPKDGGTNETGNAPPADGGMPPPKTSHTPSDEVDNDNTTTHSIKHQKGEGPSETLHPLEIVFYQIWEKTYCKFVCGRYKEFIHRILEQYSPSEEIIEEAIRKNKREDWAAEDIARICNKNTGNEQSGTSEDELRRYVEERRNTRRQA